MPYPATNTRLRVELMWPRDLVSQQYTPELRIIDEASAQPIIHITLTDDQMLRLIHGTSIALPGWMAPEPYRSRIGKYLQHSAIPVPAPMRHDYYRGEPGPTMIAWAIDQIEGYKKLGTPWDDWNLYQTNSGYELRVRRWVAEPEPEKVEA